MERFNYDFEGFSTRSGFNKSLGHFRAVMTLIQDMERGINLADSVEANFAGSELAFGQLIPIVHALLIDKYKYLQKSINLQENQDQPLSIAKEIQKWNGGDIVLTYFHPESGIVLLNPKNENHMQQLGSIKKFELINLYVGAMSETPKMIEDPKKKGVLQKILDGAVLLIQGKKANVKEEMLKGSFSMKKAKAPQKPSAKPRSPKGRKTSVPAASAKQSPVSAKAQAPPPPPRGRMTTIGPVSVQVSNELFHNGNVEAWKRIIESYKTKYPNYIVSIYYDNEKIHDINSLFKWGKVKHGTSIMFSVTAPVAKIEDISKLRKYLFQGASARFEAFLRGPVGKVLELF